MCSALLVISIYIVLFLHITDYILLHPVIASSPSLLGFDLCHGDCNTAQSSQTFALQSQTRLVSSPTWDTSFEFVGPCNFETSLAGPSFQGQQFPCTSQLSNGYYEGCTMEVLPMQESMQWLPPSLLKLWPILGDMSRPCFCSSRQVHKQKSPMELHRCCPRRTVLEQPAMGTVSKKKALTKDQTAKASERILSEGQGKIQRRDAEAHRTTICAGSCCNGSTMACPSSFISNQCSPNQQHGRCQGQRGDSTRQTAEIPGYSPAETFRSTARRG